MSREMSTRSNRRSYIGSLLIAVLVVLGITDTGQQAWGAVPTVSTVSPTSGPVAGGTAVTITGTLGTPTALAIGAETLTKVADDTASGALNSGEWSFQTGAGEIYAKTPERTGTALTVGAQQVTVTNADGASTDQLLFTYRPAFESPNLVKVVLGDLASRSQGEPVTRTSTVPYTVTGTDSVTEEPYSYTTDFYYNPASRDAYYRESVETTASLNTLNQDGSSDTEQVLFSSGGCSHNNSSPAGAAAAPNGSTQAYCSAFGPEVYTEAFYALSTQSLAFQWKAQGGGDDYEVYAFLVSVANENDIPTPSTSNHTILAHGMGDVQTTYKTSAASIPSDGLYRFRFVNGTYDATGGFAIGAKMFIKKDLTVGLSNEITFPQPSDQVASGGSYADFTVSLSSTSRGEVSVSASGKCTVSTSYSSPTTTATVSNSGGAGTCILTATRAADGAYSPSSDSVRSFEYLAAATVPGAPTVTSVTGGAGNVSVAFTPPNRNGGAAITNYQYSTDGSTYTALSPAQTSSPATISGLEFGQTYSITLKAVNSVGASSASNSVSGGPTSAASSGGGSSGSGGGSGETTVSPAEPAVVPEPVIRRPAPPPPAPPRLLEGPILRGNTPPVPPSAPVATVGGRSTPIQTQVTSPTGFSLRTGVLNLGLEVEQDQGLVRQDSSGGTEIEVKKGSAAAVSGSGFLPRSTVQVFLPLQGTNAKEIARIPVDEAGSFSGDVVFATRTNEKPLPIGKQVLQVVSLDEDGQQSVVEMTVNIAQPPPAPEPDRTVGAAPTLRPGQILATNAGEPEIVTVTPVPETRQARVEGEGWQMAVDIPSANGAVSGSDEGGALLQLVRDETAVVSGSGFMAGTRADVWLFSEPTLLGTVEIDENGDFTGEVNIDANVVAVGEHTLQLQGVGEDGYVRAANLGVVVNDTAVEVTTEEAAGGFLWWLWILVALAALIIWFALWRYRRSRQA